MRGHSNAQDDRTCGINDRPRPRTLDSHERVFGFPVPREGGHSIQKAVEAMMAGKARVFIGMGSNFVRAVPDTARAYAAMSRLDLTVGINTALNRGHVIHRRAALILPVSSRSEVIRTEKGERTPATEDVVAQLTALRGVLEPASPDCMAEAEIVCRMAMATLPQARTRRAEFAQDYAPIPIEFVDTLRGTPAAKSTPMRLVV